jgi:plasmid stabilization system protein ParE
MTPRLTFRPQARAEIRGARRHYEHQLAGLGRAFIAELEATLAYVRVEPLIFPTHGHDPVLRRALLHRFPYRLLYEIRPAGDVVVLACRHVRQDEIDVQDRRG